MVKRDLLDLSSLSAGEIEGLVQRALHYKNELLTTQESSLLRGDSVGLLFEKPSTRTRVSFEAAIVKLGGHPIFLSPNDLQIKRGETIADTARVLSGYCRALVIRTFEQEQLEAWANSATIPIINGLSNLCHPCQALTDLLTIFERHKTFAGLTLAYIGDGNNMANSLMQAGAIVGMNVTVAAPKGAQPHPEWVKAVMTIAEKSGSKIGVTDDPVKAATNADILYTDVWVSMGDEKDKMHYPDFSCYQINSDVVRLAKPNPLVMHCLPAHRGEEITDDVMKENASTIFEQARNRLPMHQAILEWLLVE
jgi:ornithine carbamoyltransferase